MNQARSLVGTVGASQLLRLSSRPARAIMAVFAISNLFYALVTLSEVKNPLPVLLAVGVVAGAAVLLVLERPDPYPMALTAAIIAAVLASTLLVAFQLPDAWPPGRAGWHLGSNTWLLFFLALRKRPGWAWIGMLVQMGATLFWATSVGRAPLDGVMLLRTHLAILLVGTLFQLNLRRTAHQINGNNLLAFDGTVESASAEVSSQIREQRVVELREVAGPLLTALVSQGPPRDAAGRLHYAAVEAQLRDAVRGRSLITEELRAAASRARSRGVEVTLLDDRGAPVEDEGAMRRLTQAVVGALEVAGEGAVTVRLLPVGRPVALSIVSAAGEARSRIDLDSNGESVVLAGARPEGFEPPTF